MPMKAVKNVVKRKIDPAKTGVDFFWYFAVIVIAFVYVLERNVISFDDNEWQMVKELVPIIGSVCGFAAYRSHTKAKEAARESQDELDEKQDELETTQDELTESKQINKGK